MFSLSRLVARNLDSLSQNSLYHWFCDFHLDRRTPYAWVRLGFGRYLSYNLEADYDERVALQFGRFMVTRRETPEEEEDRLEAEMEAAFTEREAGRYTAWHDYM